MASLSLDQLARHFDHVASLLGHYDPRPVLEPLREKLAASVQANFDSQHSPDGVPWPRLKHPDHRPLVRSGDLMAAAVEAAWHGLTEDGLAVDTDLLPSYWLPQQQGTRTIPAREFVGIPESLVAEAEDALIEDVLAKMLPG